ncbi:hypothetical protein EDD30_1742 [Couchioplanes caeruleus]|uniref:Uncharacterized protein n=1 Tax=Couchioplanes caeruleus TaxID=56438 RepID=A0A3N1GF78_9ACTN|nr:hypothetical protein EDD30_1742 [Couchioplanes caeruleus]
MGWTTCLRHRIRRDRTADLAAAETADATERSAARERVIKIAYPDRWPGWNAPTASYRPLMTRGQAARGQGGRRP